VGTPQAEPVAAAGAVVIDDAGRVLLIRRAKPPRVGAWTLPGGHIEPGETPEQAALREVLEETGVACAVVCALGVVLVAGEGFSYAVHEHLLVPIGSTRLVAADDAAEARWVDEAELSSMGLRVEVTRVIAIARRAKGEAAR
jgi:acetyl-CoA carboxylase carboxyl transferase subunit beta